MIHRRCIPIFLLFTYWRIPRPGDQMKQTCIFWGFLLWNCFFLDFHNYYLPSLASFLQLYVVPGPAAQPCRETQQTVSPQNAMFGNKEKVWQRWQKSKKMASKFHCTVNILLWTVTTEWLSVCLSVYPLPLDDYLGLSSINSSRIKYNTELNHLDLFGIIPTSVSCPILVTTCARQVPITPSCMVSQIWNTSSLWNDSSLSFILS